MCCVEGERGSRAVTICTSQTPSQLRQLNEWADLTCTVTAVFLELLQWGRGNRGQERIGLSLPVAACISLAEASPWLPASAGGGKHCCCCLPCTWSLAWLYANSAKNVCCVSSGSGLLHNQVCAILVAVKTGRGLSYFTLTLLFWNGLEGVIKSLVSTLSCSHWNSVGSSLDCVLCLSEMFRKQIAEDAT